MSEDFAFLATPYYDPKPEIREWRYREACRALALLVRQGRPTYAPIVQGHPPAEAHTLPLTAVEWWRYNWPFLRQASTLIIAQIPGWEESKGVATEIEVGSQLGLDLEYLPYSAIQEVR